MKKSLMCLLVLVSINLPFVASDAIGASESGICTDVSRLAMPLNNALTIGNISAPRKVIAFVDPDWGISARLHREMKKVVERRKDIVFYLKLYPCMSLTDSSQKSKSIICNQSMKMLEDSFERKPTPNTECKSRELDDNKKLAAWFKIDSTPALIFPNCRLEKGLISAENIIDIIDGRK